MYVTIYFKAQYIIYNLEPFDEYTDRKYYYYLKFFIKLSSLDGPLVYTVQNSFGEYSCWISPPLSVWGMFSRDPPSSYHKVRRK